jgi:hypothetical protein
MDIFAVWEHKYLLGITTENDKFYQVLVAHTCNPATQEAKIRRIMVQSPILKKPITKKGVVEWLKV